jgi:hypothetical protein
VLALANTPANAQAGATRATPDNRENTPPSTASELHDPSPQSTTLAAHVTKSRLYGFDDVVDSEAMFVRLLGGFREERIVP